MAVTTRQKGFWDGLFCRDAVEDFFTTHFWDEISDKSFQSQYLLGRNMFIRHYETEFGTEFNQTW